MQQFQKGDLVHVAKDLGPSMSHFTSDVDAIVIGSYADQYGGRNRQDYTLHLKGHGECSWYHGSQLTLLERGRSDLLDQWRADKNAEVKRVSDLDWIFAQEAKSVTHGASVEALARCLGITNMWGSHGEGFVWVENAMRVMSVALPFIEAKDQAGWLKFCQNFKSSAEGKNEVQK